MKWDALYRDLLRVCWLVGVRLGFVRLKATRWKRLRAKATDVRLASMHNFFILLTYEDIIHLIKTSN